MKDKSEQTGLNAVLLRGGREAGCNKSFQTWRSQSQDGIFQKYRFLSPMSKVWIRISRGKERWINNKESCYSLFSIYSVPGDLPTTLYGPSDLVPVAAYQLPGTHRSNSPTARGGSRSHTRWRITVCAPHHAILQPWKQLPHPRETRILRATTPWPFKVTFIRIILRNQAQNQVSSNTGL